MVDRFGRAHNKGLQPLELGGLNRALVLQLVRRYQPISRADISRRSGLSGGTTTRIVAELLRQKLLVEDGTQRSTGGRPGTSLRLNQNALFAVGIDLRRWGTRMTAGTIAGNIIQSEIIPRPADPYKALELIAAHVEEYRRSYAERQLEGVGISARGLVNPETGVIELGQDPTWLKVPVRDWLHERLQVPVFVENVVRAAAFAEYAFGGPEIRDSRCLLFVTVEEGVGFGVVLEGKVYYGPRMVAGEFGQMVIADSPGPERHDRPGCLEMLTSYEALCSRYQALVNVPPRAAVGDYATRVRRICLLAMEGDEPARQAVLETARYLGIGISNAIWGLDADAVIVDGPLTEAWPLVAAAIRDQFPDGNQFVNFRNLILRPSALRGDAAAIGAIMLPFASLFSSGIRSRARGRRVNSMAMVKELTK